MPVDILKVDVHGLPPAAVSAVLLAPLNDPVRSSRQLAHDAGRSRRRVVDRW